MKETAEEYKQIAQETQAANQCKSSKPLVAKTGRIEEKALRTGKGKGCE